MSNYIPIKFPISFSCPLALVLTDFNPYLHFFLSHRKGANQCQQKDNKKKKLTEVLGP